MPISMVNFFPRSSLVQHRSGCCFPVLICYLLHDSAECFVLMFVLLLLGLLWHTSAKCLSFWQSLQFVVFAGQLCGVVQFCFPQNSQFLNFTFFLVLFCFYFLYWFLFYLFIVCQCGWYSGLFASSVVSRLDDEFYSCFQVWSFFMD